MWCGYLAQGRSGWCPCEVVKSLERLDGKAGDRSLLVHNGSRRRCLSQPPAAACLPKAGPRSWDRVHLVTAMCAGQSLPYMTRRADTVLSPRRGQAPARGPGVRGPHDSASDQPRDSTRDLAIQLAIQPAPTCLLQVQGKLITGFLFSIENHPLSFLIFHFST